ncbi:hypothetical protein HII36_02485 [Nonomuraea sp. NN258]|uniref:hypothetical protein n=1 Tax=Nonomuraea antri TaxID=2730852 RepID=UPI0015683626|nr:hypothetical protein [Nonomuraea antri]NRQ30705.1 hypothetical protein [Nonomuraea antri]
MVFFSVGVVEARLCAVRHGDWLVGYLRMVDEQTVPVVGMTISVRTRRDVVIADSERFLAAARAAYRDLYPEVSEESAAENVRDVYDAVHILLDRYGRLAADASETLGPRGLDRPDGLVPAGEVQQVVLGDPMTLQDYGCFLPGDPFALPTEAGIWLSDSSGGSAEQA